MWCTHISHSVVDAQVMKMKATNNPVSYGRLAVDRE